MSNDSALLSELPACIKPTDGFGIIINLTGVARWQPFATWIIKISCKCLTEGALNVEGLINVPFVLAACKLLCYGDAALQMVSLTLFDVQSTLNLANLKINHFLSVLIILCTVF